MRPGAAALAALAALGAFAGPAAPPGRSAAQPAPLPPDAAPRDLAPLYCYTQVTGETTISSLSAKQLCLGAASTAPADCFQRAEELLDSSDSDALNLCQGATSTAPAECAAQLEEGNELGAPMIVSYCAEQRWPVVPAPLAGTPACVEAALDRTTLSNDAAVQLCGGSRSIGPVACYQWGRDETRLSDDDLVALCSPAAIAAPTHLTP